MGSFLAKHEAAKQARIDLERRIKEATEESERRLEKAIKREHVRLQDAGGIVSQIVESIKELTDIKIDRLDINIRESMTFPKEYHWISGMDRNGMPPSDLAIVYRSIVRASTSFSAVVTMTAAVISQSQIKEDSVEPWEDDARTIILIQTYCKQAASNSQPHPVAYFLSEPVDPFKVDIEEAIEAFVAGYEVGQSFVNAAELSWKAVRDPAKAFVKGMDAANKVFQEFIRQQPASLYPTQIDSIRKMATDSLVIQPHEDENPVDDPPF